MKTFSLGLVLATTLLTTGCAGLTGQSSVDRLNRADVNGASFTQALAREYRDFSNYEWTDMADYRDGLYYAQKGIAAAHGETVLPDDVTTRHLPDFALTDIVNAHKRLNDALDGGARERNPEMAAKAQAKLDCWMEQQEENHQAEDIAGCRQEFEDAMGKLGGKHIAAAKSKYVVFFDFGSSKLTAAGKQIVRQSVANAKASGMSGFTIVGHADTVGKPVGNDALSVARAKAVRAELLHNGILGRHVHFSGAGEKHLMVPTADNVKEQNNRRAEIVLK